MPEQILLKFSGCIPNVMYVMYVMFAMLYFFWTTPPKQQKAAHVLKTITPKPLKGLS